MSGATDTQYDSQDVARGVVVKIELPITDQTTVDWARDAEGRCVRTVFAEGPGEPYIQCFDSRMLSIEAFINGGRETYLDVVSEVPCFGRFTFKRRVQMIILSDLAGDEDNKYLKKLIVIKLSSNEMAPKVVEYGGHRAIHRETRIAFIYAD